MRARLVVLGAAIAALLALPTPALASFAVTEFKAEAINQNGTLDTRAGSHPYEATTSFTFSQGTNGEYPEDVSGNVKDIELELPPGFIGNPQATQQCPLATFEAKSEECPADTQVGVVTITFGGYLDGPDTQPVYNLAPRVDHVAEFGFAAVAQLARSVITAGVKPGDGYRVVTDAAEVPTGANQEGRLPIVGVAFTFWGVPADPTHNAERGQICDDQATFGGGCRSGGQADDGPLTPFLTNPTNCQSGPLTTTLRVDSWQSPGHYLTNAAQSPQPTGCEKLTFHPTLSVEPETTQADSPTGATFRLRVPQNPNTYGLGTPTLDDTTVTLPRGLSIDPSAANGLAGCTNEQIGIGTEDPITCPAASKLGTIEVFTPLLPNGPNGEAPLTGGIYLGTPIRGQEYRIFLAISGHGVSIRLLGDISADPTTGQLTATFEHNPPLPFSELVLRFFGGPRAALANPLSCTPATTTSDLTPYSSPETPDATPASTFQVTGCANPAPFTPTLTAGTAPSTAGAYTTFALQLSRTDGQQYISRIPTTTLPPALAANLSSVPLCPSAAAAAGTCEPPSQIGTVTVGAGPGPEPFYLKDGRVYLTEGYEGDPYGLSIVVPAIAGPYNLGTVVVRAGIAVDPHTAAVTVQADPVPTILEGIPLRLRYIDVTISRPSFILNPTNCSPASIATTVLSQQGSTASLSSPFFASNCSALPFAPVFVASTQGAASGRGSGASLDVRVAQHPGEAAIHSVHVELPKLLPARETTLNQACPEAAFAANPASCPAGSIIGSAEASTPLLANPLRGPVYFVSHAGAKFPELVTVLEGDAITIDLASETHIASTGIISSTFASVPEVPVTSFELRLPEQTNSALASPAGNLCGRTLTTPTSVIAASGATLIQATPITITGCAASDPKPKALTRAQKLKRALKACRHKDKGHNKRHERRACEALARSRYGPTTKASKASRRAKR
ncbi:MAG: hypothetical protein ACRDK7_06775 [Solirubrobacteraceae bacterium]